jgi:hypothetical protein
VNIAALLLIVYSFWVHSFNFLPVSTNTEEMHVNLMFDFTREEFTIVIIFQFNENLHFHVSSQSETVFIHFLK